MAARKAYYLMKKFRGRRHYAAFRFARGFFGIGAHLEWETDTHFATAFATRRHAGWAFCRLPQTWAHGVDVVELDAV